MTKAQSDYIKLIAIITMLIDHIGAILFPEHIYTFRVIGRIAFPLFAYQVGTAYAHTRSFKKYMTRLLVFGVAVQIAYAVALQFPAVSSVINRGTHSLNIFFTLALGLLAIYFFEKKWYVGLAAIIILPAALEFAGSRFEVINFNIEYGLYGIALVFVFYALKDNFPLMAAVMGILTLFYLHEVHDIQIFGLAALVFIAKPLSLKFRVPGYIFYIFYPLHLAILYAIAVMLQDPPSILLN